MVEPVKLVKPVRLVKGHKKTALLSIGVLATIISVIGFMRSIKNDEDEYDEEDDKEFLGQAYNELLKNEALLDDDAPVEEILSTETGLSDDGLSEIIFDKNGWSIIQF